MGEADTDTIGLIVTIIAALTVLIAGKVHQCKTGAMQHPPKITLARCTSLACPRGVFCSDYHCGHSVTLSADGWPVFGVAASRHAQHSRLD
jgi:hypothetical protein